MPNARTSFDLPLADLSVAIGKGRWDPVRNLEESERRYARTGPKLGAYITRAAEFSLAQAELAGYLPDSSSRTELLKGIAVSVKDLFGLHGSPTFAGSPARLPAAFEREGPVIAAVRRLGAVITGKTHTVEFAFGGLGTNPHWPVPRNPWDAGCHRLPGGSSAGAGVSLHCDAQLALGTDTAGSVRIPASMTGCAGLKTSHGRWPIEGVVPLCPSLDSIGILARSVADLRFAFHLIEGRLSDGSLRHREPEPPAPGDLRLGICDEFFWDHCSPGVAECVKAAVDEVARQGANLDRVIMPETGPAEELFHLGHLAAPELYEFLRSELPAWLKTLDPKVGARMDGAAEVSAYEYLRRCRRLRQLSESAQQRLQAADVLLTPTVVVTPPTLEGVATLDTYRRANLLALRNTSMANLLGLCAVTLPVGLDRAGMPVGLQLVGRYGEDPKVLAIAAAIEKIIGPPAERLGVPPLIKSI